MNLTVIMQKIWLYLGPFYLSLILCLIFSFFTKYKKKIIYLFLAINLFFSIKVYFKNIADLSKDFEQFSLSSEKKMNIISSNQHSFLKKIESFLPLDKTICYPWPSDIAGRYARQFLYPRKVELGAKEIEECNFLVLDYSIKRKEYELESELDENDKETFSSNLGRVFEIKNDN